MRIKRHRRKLSSGEERTYIYREDGEERQSLGIETSSDSVSPPLYRAEEKTQIIAALQAASSLLLVGESGIGETTLAEAVVDEVKEIGFPVAFISPSTPKQALLSIADQLGAETETLEGKPMTVILLMESISEFLNRNTTFLVVDNAHRMQTQIRCWLEELHDLGQPMLLLATHPPARDIFLKLPRIELQPLTNQQIREIMQEAADELSLELSNAQLSQLQERCGGNPMLAKRSVREEYLGLDESAPDHTQWVDGTPFLLAGLMVFTVIRFIGLGLGSTSLYLIGGMVAVAVGIFRVLLFSLPQKINEARAMKSVTHALSATAATSLFLGTSDPTLLITGALASQLPDVDTSKSIPGQILLPISQWLEKRYPHRTLTHSFIATGVVALCTLPLILVWAKLWEALILGYFCGWFTDAFTKSGVAAFYPSAARLAIPGNPHLRLSTGSNAEFFVMAILILVTIASISINSSGGILRTFNSTLGIPSGAVEIVGNEGSRYLLSANVDGRTAITQQLVQDDFEVVRPLTQNDLLVKDQKGKLYRVGTSQECQIIANRIIIKRSSPIRTRVQEVQIDEQLVSDVLAKLPSELTRTYVNGTLSLEDADELSIPTYSDRFNTTTLQPGQGIAIVRLESASPVEVSELIGDYYASGQIIIRSVEIL